MTIKLFCNAIIKFVLGIILVGLLLFLPAGTVQYPNGWLLMGVLFVPMFVAGIVMMFKNPQLLSMLWSSFFVTLVAKKYRLATMLPFVPRMVCDSR